MDMQAMWAVLDLMAQKILNVMAKVDKVEHYHTELAKQVTESDARFKQHEQTQVNTIGPMLNQLKALERSVMTPVGDGANQASSGECNTASSQAVPVKIGDRVRSEPAYRYYDFLFRRQGALAASPYYARAFGTVIPRPAVNEAGEPASWPQRNRLGAELTYVLCDDGKIRSTAQPSVLTVL